MRYYSQFKQDEFLDNNVFNKLTNGFFLEMGADDGLTHSNTVFFEKERNWEGLCVEPRISAYNKLILNRHCLCENLAISSESGTKKFLEIDNDNGQLSTLYDNADPRHLDRIKNNPTKLVDTRCLTLNELLAKNNIYHIDYFSLDIEGNELDVLKSIDYSKFSIECISVENNYDSPKIKNFLNTKGYRKLINMEVDEIYILKSGRFNQCKLNIGMHINQAYKRFKRLLRRTIKNIAPKPIKGFLLYIEKKYLSK